MSDAFWKKLDHLLATSRFIVDRPKDSTHPNHSSVTYPLDYGYLENTTGGDGQPIDVWSGSLSSAGLEAVVCTVDLLKRDLEVKLLIGCTDEDKQVICDFHTARNSAAVLVER
jgi:inorganic pyrophosphatase